MPRQGWPKSGKMNRGDAEIRGGYAEKDERELTVDPFRLSPRNLRVSPRLRGSFFRGLRNQKRLSVGSGPGIDDGLLSIRSFTLSPASMTEFATLRVVSAARSARFSRLFSMRFSASRADMDALLV